MKTYTLIKIIEDYYKSEWKKNIFFCFSQEGKITIEHAKNYVQNLKFLVQQTQPNLELASAEARKHNLKPLEEYFEKKMVEEFGHDQWAENDLQTLSQHTKSNDLLSPLSPYMIALKIQMRNFILQHPSLFLPHILFAEHFTVLATPSLIENFSTRCGLPPHAFSIITNHAELDKEHVQESLNEYDEYFSPSISDEEYESALYTSIALFDKICSSLIIYNKLNTYERLYEQRQSLCQSP